MKEDLVAFIEQELGKTYLSEWMLVDQEMIDRFADVTQDHMFLHVDPDKAAQTEFGGTIAHGFLLLSLLAPLRGRTSRPQPPGTRIGLNYGFDKVRFVNPVRSASRIRAQFSVAALEEVSPGRLREVTGVSMEVEGEDRPAVIAEWLTMFLI